MAQMVFIARPCALDEGDVLCLLAIGWPEQFAAGRPVRIGETLELHAGDHIGKAVVAIRLYLRRILRLPTRCPDNCTRLDLDDFLLHSKIDRIIFAAAFALSASVMPMMEGSST